MKTLDEVIASLKICATNYCSNPEYGDCPYMDDKYNCNISQRNADALYYLNTIYTTENLYHDAINELNAIKDEDWKDRNFPLTWDELRQMEGKAVWIDSVPLVRRWVIIKKFHPIGGNKNLFDMEVEDGGHFLRKNMRRDDPAWWQAYRKEKYEDA